MFQSFLIIVLISGVIHGNPLPSNPLVLLISMDGFRWDYLHMHNLSNFNYLKTTGSYAEFIYNAFSTVTFPNHWTLVTGLYEETHGIVQNSMYDPLLNKTFEYTQGHTQTYDWYAQNNATEPLWTTNQKAGRGRLSAAEWVGANVQFENQAHIYIPYNRSNSFYHLIDRFIELFTDDENPINFGALYFDEPGK
jgi:ectonucleotide pyrophosphatase/phosphodiesterase family protein 5